MKKGKYKYWFQRKVMHFSYFRQKDLSPKYFENIIIVFMNVGISEDVTRKLHLLVSGRFFMKQFFH